MQLSVEDAPPADTRAETGAEGRAAAETNNEAQADGRPPPRGEVAPLPASRGEE